MNKAIVLRKLLVEKNILVVPGIYDALTARITEHCGFQALYMTGFGTAAAHGYPDFGLLTMTEMLDNVRRISDAVEIPVIADADTGYGNPLNVYRTVQEYEKAGAAAIQIEDQTWPKRCGHMEGKQVIDAEEMVAKVKAAVDGRINPDTVLIIRTDAIATHGFEEAIRRGNMYVEAGADVLFIEAPTFEQMQRIPALFSKPCLMNMAMPNKDIDVKALQKMGYAIALYPGITLLGTIEGCLKMCQSLLKDGEYSNSKDIPFNFGEINKLVGLEKFKKLEERFVLFE